MKKCESHDMKVREYFVSCILHIHGKILKFKGVELQC